MRKTQTIFIHEVYYLRDELVDMGEVFNDDSILDIVLEGLMDEYLQIKFSDEADDDFTLDRAVITMLNMYANGAMRNGPLREAKGRKSATVVTSTPSAVVTCSHCKTPGHRFQNCFDRKGKMSGKKPPPPPRNKSWHNNDRHDNSDCGSQMRDDNITRRPRPGQQNGRHSNNRSAYANTATTPTSTTQMEAYVPVTHDASITAAATTAATSTSFATPPCPSSPPVGIGYSFIAAPPINIAAQRVDFYMTADSGASSHFIDNQLLPGIEHKLNHYVQLDPPVITNVAGNHRLYGVGHGVSFVQVSDHIGSKHSVQLSVTVVPGLGRHLFSRGSAAARGVTMIISTKSYLDTGAFAIPLRKDGHCSSLYHLDLTTGATRRTPETAFPTISGKCFKPETVFAVHASTTYKATSLPKTVPANTWHKRLGHPNGQVMAKVKNIADCRVIFQTLYRRVKRAKSTRALNRNILKHRS